MNKLINKKAYFLARKSMQKKKNQTNAKFSVSLFNISTHFAVGMPHCDISTYKHSIQTEHAPSLQQTQRIKKRIGTSATLSDQILSTDGTRSISTRHTNLFHPVRGSVLMLIYQGFTPLPMGIPSLRDYRSCIN